MSFATLEKNNTVSMPYSEFQLFRAKAEELNVAQKIELITFLVQSLNKKSEETVKEESVLSLKGIFKESESDKNLKDFYMNEKYGL